MIRPLFCPICGARVECPATGAVPEEYVIPDHAVASAVNMCQGLVVKVSIEWDRCTRCAANMPKHPSGLCMSCYRVGG